MLACCLLVLLLASNGVYGLTNVSIDDTNAAITYSGDWEPSSSHRSTLDFGGSHTVSSDNDATATFSFMGVAVYFLSPLWPYAVSVELSLDGSTGVTVNLTDPVASSTEPGGSESAQWSAVWGATDLTNSSHTLVISMPSNGQFIIVDGLMYSVDNRSAPSSTASISPAASQTSAADTSPVVANASPKVNAGAILGAVLGSFVFISVAMMFYFCYHRRRQRHKLDDAKARFTITSFLDPHQTPPVTPGSPNMPLLGSHHWDSLQSIRPSIPSVPSTPMMSDFGSNAAGVGAGFYNPYPRPPSVYHQPGKTLIPVTDASDADYDPYDPNQIEHKGVSSPPVGAADVTTNSQGVDGMTQPAAVSLSLRIVNGTLSEKGAQRTMPLQAPPPPPAYSEKL